MSRVIAAGEKTESVPRSSGGKFAFALCELGEKQGFFERLIAGGFAFGPQGAQFGHIPLNGAVDALLG